MSHQSIAPNHRAVTIRLNWKAYFKKFCEEHGEDPVQYMGNRLLFRDGWMYSSVDFEGPEYIPPEDSKKLDVLLLYYHRSKLAFIKQEFEYLSQMLNSLTGFQTNKSVPLQETITFENDEGKSQAVTQDWEPSVLTDRIECCQEIIDKCNNEIKSIKEKYDEPI